MTAFVLFAAAAFTLSYVYFLYPLALTILVKRATKHHGSPSVASRDIGILCS